MGQQINELISCGPAAPGWKQLDLLLHPLKENTKSPFLTPLWRGDSGREDTEEAELGFVLMATKAGSCFPNPPWGVAAGGAWWEKAPGKL